MATGFKLADGRDLSDIFTAGDAGLTVGFQASNGTDLGRQFMGGSTGVVTGYNDPSGIDLGSRFGNDPWIAQGYTPCTMLVGYTVGSSSGGTDGDSSTTHYYLLGFFNYMGQWYGAISDTSLIGTRPINSELRATYEVSPYSDDYKFLFASRGSKQTSVVINGLSYSHGLTYGEQAKKTFDYLKNHVGQNITIYLK